MAERTRTRGQAATTTAQQDSPAKSRRSLTMNEQDVSILDILMARFDKFERTIEDKMDKLEINFNNRIGELDNKMGGRIDSINSNVDVMKIQISETGEEISQIKKVVGENKIEQDVNKKEIELLKIKLNRSEDAKGALINKINQLEDKSRAMNIKIEGKPEEEGENLKDYIKGMIETMGVREVGPDDTATRIGRKLNDRQMLAGKNNRPRIIMINFANTQSRNNFYYARSRLGKSREYRGIYLNDDVSNLTARHRDEFRAVAALARAKGDEVRVHGDGVIINQIKYRHEDTLPDKYSIDKAKVVEVNGQIYFQSEHAHLSNFYPAPIYDSGIFYQTAEHHYQAAKCRQAGEETKVRQILKAETPLEAKRIGDSIPENIEWRRQKEMKMEITINLKYDQNPHLAELLLDTKDLKLNEATGNTFFGIGASLHSKALRDRSYGGLNKLGEILENKRSELRNSKK